MSAKNPLYMYVCIYLKQHINIEQFAITAVCATDSPTKVQTANTFNMCKYIFMYLCNYAVCTGKHRRAQAINCAEEIIAHTALLQTLNVCACVCIYVHKSFVQASTEEHRQTVMRKHFIAHTALFEALNVYTYVHIDVRRKLLFQTLNNLTLVFEDTGVRVCA